MRPDLLSQLTTVKATDMTKSTCLEILDVLSLDEAEAIMATTIETSWMDPLIAYFTDSHLLEDEVEDQRLIKKAFHYAIYGGKLYRTLYTTPLLRCP